MTRQLHRFWQHGHQTRFYSLMVDVPSQQPRRGIEVRLWQHGHQTRFYSLMVDVPRFELGNRNAERIRCFILGFQVAERLAAWNNTRYGGGL